MSLNWNVTKVKDWDTMTDEERSATDSLVWLTMAVGIMEITEENAREFYARLKLIELLNGAMRTVDGKPHYFTFDEVQRNIGLKTNAARFTRSQFNKIRLNRFYEDALKED